MNELLQSLRFDLLSRRMLPLLALALLVLAVAVSYALGGGSQSASPTPRSSQLNSSGQALAVSPATPNPNAAVAETPGGLRYQSKGASRNPFSPLPGAKSASASSSKSSSGNTSSASKSASGSGSSSSGSSSPKSSESGSSGKTGGGKSTPAPTPPKPSKPSKKAEFPYDVSILFGKLPATAGQEVTLPPYQNLQPRRSLPSSSDARIALERVGGNAKSAVFALLEPAILRGAGVCLPSPSECQQLALETGRAEELEYIEGNGQTLVYELKTVSIVKSSSQAVG